MELDSLFTALLGADKQARESAPYNEFKSVTDQIAPQMILGSAPDASGNKRYSTAESILGPLIIGALGGLADRGNDSYVTDRNAEANDLMAGILNGLNPEKPRMMSPSIYSTLGNAGKVYNIEQQAGIEAEQRKIRNDIGMELIKGTMADPYGAPKGIAAVNKLIGGQTAPAEPMVQNELEPYLEKFGGDEAAARSAFDYDRAKPDRLTTLRKEFSAKPEVQNFLYADTGFKAMQEAFKDTSGQSDIELTRRAIQAIEPGLAVRTDDQTAIANSASLTGAYKANMLGAITGKTKLDPEVREGLMRIAQRSYNAYGEQFNKALGFYKTQATNAQLDPGGITYQGEAAPSTANFSALTDLARKFPNTPEGKAQFKAEAAKLGYK